MLGIDFRFGESYVIKAPTGSGKTTFVINEVFKQCLEKRWKIFYTTSLREASKEVYERACSIYGVDKVGRVDGTVKDFNVRLQEFRKPIVITTFEELAILFRKYFRQGRTPYRTYVVIDEYHHVLQDRRKYVLLELLAFCKLWNLPVILCSATMPQVRELGEYLNGNWYDLGSNLQNKEIHVHLIEEGVYPFVAQLAVKYAEKGYLVAIFYESKKGLRFIYNENCCICYRGIEDQERDECVKKVRNREVGIVLSTSVLGEGVNLPLDVGIIVVNQFMKPWKIVQTMGRIGRKGLSIVDKGIIHIVYNSEFRRYVEDALSERYGEIKVDSLEDLLISYLTHELSFNELKTLVKQTFACEYVTDEDIKLSLERLKKLKIIEEKVGGLLKCTRIGQLMNNFNILFKEFLNLLICMKLYNDMFEIVTCTLCRLGEADPEIGDQSRMFITELESMGIKIHDRWNTVIHCSNDEEHGRKTICKDWVIAFLQARSIYLEDFERWFRFLVHFLPFTKYKHLIEPVKKCVEAIDKFYEIAKEQGIYEARKVLLNCVDYKVQTQITKFF